jgi:hypothetical protein
VHGVDPEFLIGPSPRLKHFACDGRFESEWQEMHPVIPVHIEEQPRWALRHMHDGRNLSRPRLGG